MKDEDRLQSLLAKSRAFEQRASAVILLSSQLQEALKLVAEFRQLALIQNGELTKLESRQTAERAEEHETRPADGTCTQP